MTPVEERDYGLRKRAIGAREDVCQRLETERPRRPWSEQVLPYGLVAFIAPSGWTLTESSREVRLPAHTLNRG